MRAFISFLLIYSLFLTNMKAQTPEKTWLEQYIEDLAESSESDEAQGEILEILESYLANPLNLNTATAEELAVFPFLSIQQTEALFTYLERNRQMISIYEIQYVKYFDYETISKLLPFITVIPEKKESQFNLSKYLSQGKSNLFLRTQFLTQNQLGYTDASDSLLNEKPDARYLGSKYKIYARYAYQYKKVFKYGFTLEKDAGEEFFSSSQKQGFDYMSGFLQFSELGKIQNLIIGSYSASFGQGLIMGSSFGGSKSAYTTGIMGKAGGFKKYSSTDENQYLQGIASTIQWKNLYFNPFFSYKKSDAQIEIPDSLDDFEVEEAGSLQNTGLHSTPSELEDKKAVNILLSGASIKYRAPKFNAAINYVYTHFSPEINLQSRAYQLYAFSGNQTQHFSLDYYYLIKSQVHLFGENALSGTGAFATVNGIILKPAPQISVSALYRNYSADYWSLYAGGFGETSNTSNESGFYLGTEIYPAKNWKISAYIDSYRFPWMSFSAYSPSDGFDYLVQIEKNISRYAKLLVKYKNEKKQANISETTHYQLSEKEKESFRVHLEFAPGKNIMLKSRAEFAHYNFDQTKETGYMIYQDLSYKFLKIPLNFSARFALFNTTYNTRIYAYENDILYAFSVPAYFYQGTRSYFNIKYSVSDRIDIWARWGQFYYPKLEKLSSGLAEIDGNKKTEIKIQMRIRF